MHRVSVWNQVGAHNHLRQREAPASERRGLAAGW